MTITLTVTDHSQLEENGPSEGAQPPRPTSGESYTVQMRPGFHLSRERDGDRWIVTDADSGIHGVGQSPGDALADFFQAARQHLDVLERQNSLSDDLAAQFEYLRERIRRDA
jgi:hypothetical protein